MKIISEFDCFNIKKFCFCKVTTRRVERQARVEESICNTQKRHTSEY